MTISEERAATMAAAWPCALWPEFVQGSSRSTRTSGPPKVGKHSPSRQNYLIPPTWPLKRTCYVDWHMLKTSKEGFASCRSHGLRPVSCTRREQPLVAELPTATQLSRVRLVRGSTAVTQSVAARRKDCRPAPCQQQRATSSLGCACTILEEACF